MHVEYNVSYPLPSTKGVQKIDILTPLNLPDKSILFCDHAIR